MKPNSKRVSEFLAESNQIEGFEYVAEDYLPAVRKPSTEASPMIKNSALAWNYVLKRRAEPIDHTGILGIHRLVMDGFSYDNSPGVYRRGIVMVGGYMPPAPSVLHYHVQRYLEHVADPNSHPLHSHILFEMAHPFYDGNGRVGRLLWAWDRLLRGLKIRPLLSFMKGESFLEKKKNYYLMIRHVQNKGTFESAKELYCLERA